MPSDPVWFSPQQRAVLLAVRTHVLAPPAPIAFASRGTAPASTAASSPASSPEADGGVSPASEPMTPSVEQPTTAIVRTYSALRMARKEPRTMTSVLLARNLAHFAGDRGDLAPLVVV